MKIINNIIILLAWLINIISLVLKITTEYEVNILVCIALSIIVILPKFLRKWVRISDLLEFILLIFIFFAGEIGSVLKVYGIIYWYDSFTHFISGILTAFLGLVILNRFKKYDDKELWNVFFIIIFTLSIAATWEIFEFTSDNLLGGDAQRVIETGVADTMKDIICALIGSILFSVGYLFKRPKIDNL
ncbi:MAG: DUF2238 domain-containing protein [Clostridium sp.]|nr:DUF2238 domain-containing protein [Clostridium sp.]MCM1444523.1 DUF2238 domain-containing protein [Candidatus Amulumruptor caecigallinarius]